MWDVAKSRNSNLLEGKLIQLCPIPFFIPSLATDLGFFFSELIRQVQCNILDYSHTPFFLFSKNVYELYLCSVAAFHLFIYY